MYLCELWCVDAFLSSTTSFMMCNCESDLISLLSPQCPLETTTLSPLPGSVPNAKWTHLKVNWDPRGRFIYRKVKGKKEGNCGVLPVSKSWTKRTERGRMTIIATVWAPSGFYSSPPPDLPVQLLCNSFPWCWKEMEDTRGSVELQNWRIYGRERERLEFFQLLNPDP